MWQLSDAGRALLDRCPDGIPDAELQKIARRKTTNGDEAAVPVIPAPGATPEERLRTAYVELRQRTRAELLDAVRNASPSRFEAVVLDLLHAMGYGRRREDLRQSAAGADGGIDGVISLDRLGLEKVYVQAKRYAEDNAVSRPAIQAFLGALAGRRALKGVFMTTSRFSRDARDFAATASDSLVLVDGEQLADLLIDHRVGVQARETLVLMTTDRDYFEDDET
jgi:restriction system protein